MEWILEKLIKRLTRSRFNYIFSFYFDGVTALLLLYLALQRGDATPLSALVSFVVGFLLFSFIEYAFHAWLFHGKISIFVTGHAAHHKDPFGYDALPFFFGSLVALVLYALAALVVGETLALLFASGVLSGYLAYGLMHHAMHRIYPNNRYFRYMVSLHDMHHQNIRKNHGVTSPVWDILLGTYDPTPPSKSYNLANRAKRVGDEESQAS